MDNLLSLIGPLGCGLMMVVCMRSMAKGKRHRDNRGEEASAEDVAALRAEVARLRGEQREPADG